MIHALVFATYTRFQVKKKQFFVNFITIVMFGAIGTLVSCSIIALGTSGNSLHEVRICPYLVSAFMTYEWKVYKCDTNLWIVNLPVFLDSGATQIFKKLDIGSLDIGDYLGIFTFSVSLLYLAPISVFTIFNSFFQQLVQYLLRRILYARCRYGTYQFTSDFSSKQNTNIPN